MEAKTVVAEARGLFVGSKMPDAGARCAIVETKFAVAEAHGLVVEPKMPDAGARGLIVAVKTPCRACTAEF